MSTSPSLTAAERAEPPCQDCVYFHRHEGLAGQGDCRRYPPVYVGGEGAAERHRWRHPLVHQLHWCGEWTAPRGADSA